MSPLIFIFFSTNIISKAGILGKRREQGGRIGKARSRGKAGERQGQATRKGSNLTLPRGAGGSGSSRNDPEGELGGGTRLRRITYSVLEGMEEHDQVSRLGVSVPAVGIWQTEDMGREQVL